MIALGMIEHDGLAVIAGIGLGMLSLGVVAAVIAALAQAAFLFLLGQH